MGRSLVMGRSSKKQSVMARQQGSTMHHAEAGDDSHKPTKSKKRAIPLLLIVIGILASFVYALPGYTENGKQSLFKSDQGKFHLGVVATIVPLMSQILNIFQESDAPHAHGDGHQKGKKVFVLDEDDGHKHHHNHHHKEKKHHKVKKSSSHSSSEDKKHHKKHKKHDH